MLPDLRFLVIEDNKFDFKAVSAEINKNYKEVNSKCDIVWATSLNEGLSELEKQKFDIVLLDLNLPDVSPPCVTGTKVECLHAISKIQVNFPKIPIIVITGLDSEEMALETLKLGAQDYLVKGQFNNKLLKSIRFAIERQEMLEALEDAKMSAQKASEAKSDFLTNMSHEIRTPLTAILGFTEIALSEAEVEKRESGTLSSINQNVEHLLNIVNDILDISKIEAGKLEVVKETFSLQKLISEVEGAFKLKCNEKNVSFGVECDFPLPQKINTDFVKLKQILLNVVGNAVKFTKYGGVKTLVAYSKESKELSFKVIDTGIGLTEEEQQKIFFNFSQADSSTVRDYGGTGLGLSISKKLATALGGEISLSSEKGRGSTFTVSLHLEDLDDSKLVTKFIREKPSSFTGSSNSTSNLISGKVLIVDDMPDNRELMNCLLKPQGAELEFAESGIEALEKVGNSEPDIILLDIQMPEMDGYETAQTLRERGFTKPIIAVTASSTKEALDKTIEAGCNEYISKPFRKTHLFESLKKYIGLSQVVDSCSSCNISDSTVLGESPELAGAVLSFIDRLPGRLDSIEQAFEISDWDVLKTLAHRLAGAELFGYPKVGVVARTLEAAALNKEEDEIYSLINSLHFLEEKVSAGRGPVEEMIRTNK